MQTETAKIHVLHQEHIQDKTVWWIILIFPNKFRTMVDYGDKLEHVNLFNDFDSAERYLNQIWEETH